MRQWRQTALRAVALLLIVFLCGMAAAQTGDAKGLVGNSGSKKYHKTSCRWAGKISEKHRVAFGSAEEAEKADYAACKVCFKKARSRR